MAIVHEAIPRSGTRCLRAAIDVQCAADATFALLCAIEKWPVWLSFLRSARLVGGGPEIGPGSEVVVRSALPGDPEQVYEVDHFIQNHHLSLVGAYSIRRRLDFRIERKTSRCKLHVRIEYPAYGGRLAMLYDGIRAGRRLMGELAHSLTAFKHLAEYQPKEKDDLIADF